jgi:hypothetical protein
MSDIVATLRECAEDSRKSEGDYYADQFSTDASVFDEAADEIERLRRQVSQQENSTTCPHVVGKTTQYCSLTPFTLTDEEREAIGYFAAATGPQYLEATNHYAAVAKALLERLS